MHAVTDQELEQAALRVRQIERQNSLAMGFAILFVMVVMAPVVWFSFSYPVKGTGQLMLFAFMAAIVAGDRLRRRLSSNASPFDDA